MSHKPTVFDKFRIPIKEIIDNICEINNITLQECYRILGRFNLIGLDLGDGMICAYYVSVGFDGNVSIRNLTFNSNIARPQIQSAIYISKTGNDGEDVTLIENEENMQPRDDADLYYNFKRCPIIDTIGAKYMFDNTEVSNYTYGEVIQKTFKAVIKRLFEANSGFLRQDCPTIVLVGRPGNKVWENSENAYAELLQSALNAPGVHAAVASEAISALARETNPCVENCVQPDEIVLVIDLGSSTFDAVVITPEGISEDLQESYQFGGNKLDEILEKQLIGHLHDNGINAKSESGHRLQLRAAKELYFNKDHTRQTCNIAVVPYEKDGALITRYEYHITDKVMDEALNNHPTVVHHLVTSDAGPIPISTNVDSWLNGCRFVLNGFREKFYNYLEENGMPMPNRIILTGGVAEMEEVKDLVQECFGMEPSVTRGNKLAVAEGLAYMLKTEMKKQIYIEEVMAQAERDFPSEYELRREIVSVSVNELLDILVKTADAWRQKNVDSSYQDCWNEALRIRVENECNLIVPHVREAAKNLWDENDFDRKIKSIVDEKFSEIFPGYEQPRQFNVNSQICCDGLEVDSNNDVFTFSPEDEDLIHIFGLHTNCYLQISKKKKPEIKRNKYERQKIYEKLIENKNDALDFMIPKFLRTFSSTNGETIRREILSLLKDQIIDYVEEITPYLVRSHIQ